MVSESLERDVVDLLRHLHRPRPIYLHHSQNVLKFTPMARAENSSANFFGPQKIVHPTISQHTKGVFRGSFSPRAQNPIPESGSTEGSRVGTRREFLFLRHESGPCFWGGGSSTKAGTNSVTKSPNCLSPFFHRPPKLSMPNPRHFRGQNPRQFRKKFLNGGCSTLVCVAAFGCQYVYADQ